MMKKCLERLMAAVLLLTATFALGGCSDDDEGVVEGSIVGTWKCTSLKEAEDLFGQQYVQFREDGTYIEVDITDDYVVDGEVLWEGEVEILRGRWTQDGTSIHVSGPDIVSIDTQITNLTDTRLTLTTVGIPLSYVRVDDSEIEQYL